MREVVHVGRWRKAEVVHGGQWTQAATGLGSGFALHLVFFAYNLFHRFTVCSVIIHYLLGEAGNYHTCLNWT